MKEKKERSAAAGTANETVNWSAGKDWIRWKITQIKLQTGCKKQKSTTNSVTRETDALKEIKLIKKKKHQHPESEREETTSEWMREMKATEEEVGREGERRLFKGIHLKTHWASYQQDIQHYQHPNLGALYSMNEYISLLSK